MSVLNMIPRLTNLICLHMIYPHSAYCAYLKKPLKCHNYICFHHNHGQCVLGVPGLWDKKPALHFSFNLCPSHLCPIAFDISTLGKGFCLSSLFMPLMIFYTSIRSPFNLRHSRENIPILSKLSLKLIPLIQTAFW